MHQLRNTVRLYTYCGYGCWVVHAMRLVHRLKHVNFFCFFHHVSMCSPWLRGPLHSDDMHPLRNNVRGYTTHVPSPVHVISVAEMAGDCSCSLRSLCQYHHSPWQTVLHCLTVHPGHLLLQAGGCLQHPVDRVDVNGLPRSAKCMQTRDATSMQVRLGL